MRPGRGRRGAAGPRGREPAAANNKPPPPASSPGGARGGGGRRAPVPRPPWPAPPLATPPPAREPPPHPPSLAPPPSIAGPEGPDAGRPEQARGSQRPDAPAPPPTCQRRPRGGQGPRTPPRQGTSAPLLPRLRRGPSPSGRSPMEGGEGPAPAEPHPRRPLGARRTGRGSPTGSTLTADEPTSAPRDSGTHGWRTTVEGKTFRGLDSGPRAGKEWKDPESNGGTILLPSFSQCRVLRRWRGRHVCPTGQRGKRRGARKGVLCDHPDARPAPRADRVRGKSTKDLEVGPSTAVDPEGKTPLPHVSGLLPLSRKSQLQCSRV